MQKKKQEQTRFSKKYKTASRTSYQKMKPHSRAALSAGGSPRWTCGVALSGPPLLPLGFQGKCISLGCCIRFMGGFVPCLQKCLHKYCMRLTRTSLFISVSSTAHGFKTNRSAFTQPPSSIGDSCTAHHRSDSITFWQSLYYSNAAPLEKGSTVNGLGNKALWNLQSQTSCILFNYHAPQNVVHIAHKCRDKPPIAQINRNPFQVLQRASLAHSAHIRTHLNEWQAQV